MSTGSMSEGRMARIELIDALRGLSLVLMCVHHFAWDLYLFEMLPGHLLFSWWVNCLHYIFASLFILLAGMSSRFSRSNIKRGVKVLLCGLAVTAVTWVMDMPVIWGILQLLGLCMIVYGLLSRFLERQNQRALFALWLGLFALGIIFIEGRYFSFARGQAGIYVYSILGWFQEGFYSSDYFPVLPWIFMFLAGTVFGGFVKQGLLPPWFYSCRVRVFPAIGRKSLWIYMLHQPVLYGLTIALSHIFK